MNGGSYARKEMACKTWAAVIRVDVKMDTARVMYLKSVSESDVGVFRTMTNSICLTYLMLISNVSKVVKKTRQPGRCRQLREIPVGRTKWVM